MNKMFTKGLALMLAIIPILTIGLHKIDAQDVPIENSISSAMQSFSKAPSITSVDVHECRIEIIVEYSKSNHCDIPQSADFLKTTISLLEVREIIYGPQTSRGMVVNFVFTPDVSSKIDAAMAILKTRQKSQGESNVEQSVDQKNIAGNLPRYSSNLFQNIGFEYQDIITSCDGKEHIQIISHHAKPLLLGPNVPQKLLRDLTQYLSMCHQNF